MPVISPQYRPASALHTLPAPDQTKPKGQGEAGEELGQSPWGDWAGAESVQEAPSGALSQGRVRRVLVYKSHSAAFIRKGVL